MVQEGDDRVIENGIFEPAIADSSEPVESLSPFDGGGSFKSDGFWLHSTSKRSSATTKKKKKKERDELWQ